MIRTGSSGGRGESGQRSAVSVHPLAPVLSRENDSLGESSFVRTNACVRRSRPLSVIRVPVLVTLAVVPRGHAPVTHQDQGFLRSDRTAFAPGSHEPQKTVGTRSCPNGWPSFRGITAEQHSGLRPQEPRQVASGSRPRRTRVTTPAIYSAISCLDASAQGTVLVIRIGDGVPISLGGSKPERCPGSPSPSSIGPLFLQRLC